MPDKNSHRREYMRVIFTPIFRYYYRKQVRDAGKSKTEFAEAMGVNESCVDAYINGDRKPTYTILGKMARFLKVSERLLTTPFDKFVRRKIEERLMSFVISMPKLDFRDAILIG